ncbi:AGC family protein kinase [Histomonas meleagridis]|uniref:AGC family protein kinase n=1 Tax=Histomonas meleagridis TaxID=135588 RepID=UPI00355A9D37|nr:AGC family protein kinase [Histomonas meleagridis]KAH0800778.1 AGC family protein kinase [Histomonas meleagridis]
MSEYLKLSDSGEITASPHSLPDPETGSKQAADPRLTFVKTEATKIYLNESFKEMFENRKERKRRASLFRRSLENAKMTSKEKKRAKEEFSKNESEITRMQRARISSKDFQKLKLIGCGTSGEVWLVKDTINSRFCAMKIVNKLKIIINDQAESVKTERTLLATIDNPWVVKLYYSFQDPENLYFVFEFVQGGDMFSLLDRFTMLDEDFTRFYIAEIALAIDSIHRAGYVHRDIKPENILITTKGHIKLADFGLSIQFDRSNSDFAQVLEELKRILVGEDEFTEPSSGQYSKPASMVGTIEYVAPEILTQEEYDRKCDWWSLGIVMYEMLYGQTPFASPSATETALKIVRWKKHLAFPSVPSLSDEAIDLMKSLLTDADKRISFHKIKHHPFFNGLSWGALQQREGPYIPKVNGPDDISAFQPNGPPKSAQQLPENDQNLTKYAFLGFTYKAKKKGISSLDMGFK